MSRLLVSLLLGVSLTASAQQQPQRQQFQVYQPYVDTNHQWERQRQDNHRMEEQRRQDEQQRRNNEQNQRNAQQPVNQQK